MHPNKFIAIAFSCLSTFSFAETVELTDGRVVVLNEDGTYEFSETVSRTTLDINILEPFFQHHAGEFDQNSMRFMPVIQNATGKEIVGFQFTSTFLSAFGDEVFAFSGESSERIAEGQTSSSDTFYLWKDNQFMAGQPYDKLKIFESSGTGSVQTDVTAVVFADGSLWRDDSE